MKRFRVEFLYVGEVQHSWEGWAASVLEAFSLASSTIGVEDWSEYSSQEVRIGRCERGSRQV